MSEQNANENLSIYATKVLNAATGLSSSLAVSTTAIAIFAYIATPGVVEIPEHVGNAMGKTGAKLDFLLPPIMSSWLYFATFVYMLIRVPSKMLNIAVRKNGAAKARTIFFYLCFGLLLMQNLKLIESFRNCMTVITLQRTI
jgi:hypothetical protein